MKRIFFTLIALVVVAAAIFAVMKPSGAIMNTIADNSSYAEEEEEGKLHKSERIQEALEYQLSLKVNEFGEYNIDMYYNAIEQADMLKQAGTRDLDVVWEFLGPDNVGGRIRAILVDKDNPKRVYAGGVAGGIWWSENGGNTWTPAEGFDHLAIGCIAQASNGDLYVGTGEPHVQVFGTVGSSGMPGNGIYKSTDRGETWTQLPATAYAGISASNDWSIVSRIAIDPNDPMHQFAALQEGGLVETFDDWATVSSASGITGSRADDVKFGSSGDLVVAVVNDDLWSSLDGGNTWNNMSISTTANFPNVSGRIELAIAPSDENYVYALYAAGGGCLQGVYQSQDKGQTWVALAEGSTAAFEPFNIGICQGWYDNIIAVSPADPEKVYIGGVEFWTWSPSTSFKRADIIGTEGGSYANERYIHADKHGIAFHPTDPNVMYVSCDGGVHKSTNAVSEFPYPTYTQKNKGLNITQFYSAAASIDGSVIGGTQDNGTQYIDYQGNTYQFSDRVLGGDGSYSDISKINPNIFVGSIYEGQLYRSGNKGGSWSCALGLEVDSDGDCEPDAGASFISFSLLAETFDADVKKDSVTFTADKDYAAGDTITVNSKTQAYPFEFVLPVALSEGDDYPVQDIIDSRLYLGGVSGRLWFTPEGLNTSGSSSWYRITGLIGSPLSLDHSANNDILFVGTTSGRVYRIEGITQADYSSAPTVAGLTVTEVLTISGGLPITGVAIDKNNSDHVIVTVGGFSGSAGVRKTTNGGATWTNVTNNLPQMPCYDGIIDINNPDNYIIGTELGVWTSDDGGANWTEQNTADLTGASADNTVSPMGRVPVFRVRQVQYMDTDCYIVYIGTHGRGIYRTTSLGSASCPSLLALDAPSIKPDVLDFQVYPNPVSGNGKVSLTLSEADEVKAHIIDMPGRVVKTIDFGNLPAGVNTLDFDVNGMPNGTYLMTVRVGDAQHNSKLFIVAN